VRNDILQCFLELTNIYGFDEAKNLPKDNHKLMLALLNKDTEILEICKWERHLWNDYEDRLSTMLEQVSRTATNLKSIMVKSSYCFEDHLSSPCLDFNAKMTSLHTLVINAEWNFADEDLSTLAEMFPNLKSLSVS
jgi:hypothetical protein